MVFCKISISIDKGIFVDYESQSDLKSILLTIKPNQVGEMTQRNIYYTRTLLNDNSTRHSRHHRQII